MKFKCQVWDVVSPWKKEWWGGEGNYPLALTASARWTKHRLSNISFLLTFFFRSDRSFFFFFFKHFDYVFLPLVLHGKNITIKMSKLITAWLNSDASDEMPVAQCTGRYTYLHTGIFTENFQGMRWSRPHWKKKCTKSFPQSASFHLNIYGQCE